MEQNPEEDQPSTSSAFDPNVSRESIEEKNDNEMERLLEATDKILENKAKSMNLSSLNVRSILHHLIKYPATIDVLLGIRENDSNLPSVRNMRSRKKADGSVASSTNNTPKKFALRIEDKGPKNFLDLEYEEDDEYDDDYVEERDCSRQNDGEAEESEDEELDEEEEEEDDDEDEEESKEVDKDDNEKQEKTGEEAETSSDLDNEELNELLFGEGQEQDESHSLQMTLNDTRPGSAALVHTLDNVVDDDDYRNFVISIKCPAEDFDEKAGDDTEDDTEDEDYNVIADNLNVEDWDETRQDKTTQIPRHEVKALMMDTLLAEKEIPLNIFPEETTHAEDPKKRQQRKSIDTPQKDELTASSAESCSLLRYAPVTFRPQEIDQLRTQLEQHVQLLTQFVVTCHHDDTLSHVRNDSQLMLNELDDIRQQKPSTSVFNVSNLDAAITSCHDINDFPKVDDSLLNYAQNTDRCGGQALRPEAAAVLSRSEAIRYPGLLPPCQPIYIEKPLPFLNEEDVMLAVAILQFHHLPRRADKEVPDRYTMIHKHCLPARDPYKIRSHLKSMRKESKNPIHQIIQAAEQGISKITIPAKTWRQTDSPIYTWPSVSQPGWFREFKKVFNVTEDKQIHRKSDSTLIMTPIKQREKYMSSGSHDDKPEYVDIGKGPDGRTIKMNTAHVEELVEKLNYVKSSNRRKNPTPMKLSTAPETENVAQKTKPSRSSKAARKLECTKDTSKNSANSSVKKEMIDEQKPSCSYTYESNEDYSFCQSVQNCSIPTTTRKSRRPQSDSRQVPETPGDLYGIDTNSLSGHSYPIPPTPGRRSPDEHDDFFMDLETNSLLWARESPALSLVNPRTPRGFSMESEYMESDPTDFSSLNDYELCDLDAVEEPSSSYWNVGYSTDLDYENSNSGSIPDAPPSASPVNFNMPEPVIEDDTSMPGLDLVPPDDEECEEDAVSEKDETPVKVGLAGSRPPLRMRKLVAAGNTAIRASRKRTRAEREAMGAIGLDDELYHEKQKDKIMRKVIDDIGKRLFMHGDTYEKFKETILNEELSEIERVSRIMQILKNHRELLILVLLYAPPEAIVSDYDLDFNSLSYKSAVEMMMAIERYITAAKLKEPSLKGLFRFVQTFLEDDPNLTDEQATMRFYQLFGQDRPLWKKLESHFWCLPFKRKAPRWEQFEYVDLTGLETRKKPKSDWKNVPPRFETIDNIDEVLRYPYKPAKNEPPSNLVVKCGEMCIQKEDESFIQLEITERHWTKQDDIDLLTAYNEALKTVRNFTESMIPSFVPDLPFGEKSKVARLQYLLEELRKMEEEDAEGN
ncbi:hypothetical protein L3Y34_004512 [Caenorhabditis briggsae]|uniref:Uncharacterized protein n=2 Tax=Caenorhabditis briggsae TaxID=6238 RepID=A0AAE9AAS4_CAEBR|nr:hypothetical protein L3Y34_004512 [Caenorhabditis briggsae]